MKAGRRTLAKAYLAATHLPPGPGVKQLRENLARLLIKRLMAIRARRNRSNHL